MVPTTITYNGVVIQYVEVTSASTTAQYDEDGVQVVARARSITFNGLVQDTAVDDFVEALQEIELKLTTPRKALEIKFVDSGSSVWVDARPAYGAAGSTPEALYDIANGPKPQNVVVTRIVGGRAAIVQMTIEWTEPIAATVTPYVLGHRWTQRFSVDENNYGRRVVDGLIRFATNVQLSDMSSPDAFRDYVAPKYIDGWKRIRSDWIIAADYLTLRYQVEDQEMYRPFPGTAINGMGQYEQRANAGKLYKTFTITLIGEKRSAPGGLLLAAYRAMKTRIRVGVSSNLDDFLMEIAVNEDLFQNRITLTAIAESSLSAQPTGFPTISMVGMFADLDPTNPDRQQFRQPTAYGTAMVRAAAQAIFDQETGSRPTNPMAVAKASVVSSGIYNAQSDERVIQAVNASILESDILASNRSGRLSSEQLSAKNYSRIVASAEVVVENNILTVPSAYSASASAYHQVAPPEVVIRHRGVLERIGSPPTIPPAVVGTDALLRNYRVTPGPTRITGVGDDLTYTAMYEYEVVIPFTGVAAGGFADAWKKITKTTPAADFVTYGPNADASTSERTQAYEQHASLSVQPSVLPIPAGFLV